jgi:superfamily II DNA/RNA helicase
MSKEYSPSRAPRSASDAAPKKRSVAPKWDAPKRDGAAAPKREGRPGYTSNKGDYVPKGERSGGRDFNSDRPNRDSSSSDRDRSGGRDFNPSDRKPRAKSDRPDRVQRETGRDKVFEKARATTGKTFQGDKKLDRLQSTDAKEVVSFATFEEMGLPERLVDELVKMGAATPFPIQASTIPAALEGRHVLGRGKTGSGKTIAFGVPLVAFLAKAGNQPRVPFKPKALVLAPTRELADQIDRTLSQLAKSVGFFTTTIYGGVPQYRQEQALKRGVDIIIATPGRLEDLMAQGLVDLSSCERVVVDEADHMCDLGFVEPVNRILSAAGESQKLLFSATLDQEVAQLVKKYMPNPYVYEVPGEVEESSDIDHKVLVIDPRDRSAVFHRLVQGSDRSIVFVRTKSTAEALAMSLNDAGVPTARLHGDLNQAQRTRNLERFTKGAARVMVATDVAARGIHVDDVKLVIQLDLPEEYKTYLHRAGRTGRAGRSGTVVSLVPMGRTRKAEDLLKRADRTADFTQVKPGDAIIEELAGPIAPPPIVDFLDFGDSRFESMNRDKAKKDLRAKHTPNKLYQAKDRRYRGR